MKLGKLALAALLLPLPALAEDSVFDSYDAYANYVDESIMNRDFVPLVQQLGGRDEYTREQLAEVNAQLLRAMPFDFTKMTILKREDYGNGFSKELRAYWSEELNYSYFYAFLHDRGEKLIVLRFALNTNEEELFKRF
ncbi:hypothetical protein NBRC116590_29930 [Pelagimonas sp. KU-00592-HH]|uniref:hypothetical protein n=1 Tax=Pelagimonas sp. KU-00592-HH TaxID=3127651 RepID=UPI00310923E0